MLTTSPSLLQKLREPNQSRAWERFIDLYTPLLLTWARRAGLQPQDAADLVQDVFALLVQQLPQFTYDPQKRNFRGWLRTVCLNKWRDRQRVRAAHLAQANTAELSALEAPPELAKFWDAEHDAFLVKQALRMMRELESEFEPPTVAVCWEFVVKQRPGPDVAAEFGISENAVYLAKLRVLRRLRQELADFLE
jgi:RNA polymerase sigma-70 factor (ECF subfamily)